MPPRSATLLILAFWLFAAGWFVKREYLPHWLAVDAPPEPVIELADEAAPRLTTWNLLRDGRKIGYLYSQIRFLGTERTCENESKLLNLDLRFEQRIPFFGEIAVHFYAPSILTTTVSDKEGRLLTLQSKAKIELTVTIKDKAKTTTEKFLCEAELDGKVTGDSFGGKTVFKSPLGNSTTELKPFPVRAGMLFNPFQPHDRMQGLRVGRSWKLPLFDPVFDVYTEALKQSIAGLAKGAAPTSLPGLGGDSETQEVVGEVTGIEPLEWRGGSHQCYVIEHTGKAFKAKTWVRTGDGKVLLQESEARGEKLTLIRDNQ